MVGWYDPLQLLGTARQTILADIFGGRADFRLHQGGRGGEQPLDYSERFDAKGAIWIDYVADMGDGFDSTFSVARALAAPALSVDGLSLPRGQLLVMGGDQVYPTPDDDSYLSRLVDPYELALPPPATGALPADAPHLLAVPGNHDWYDGLQSFVKVFCRRARIGGWVTPQSRSYFALRLPHKFWLFGLDTQLNGDVDDTQLAYFSGLDIQRGDQVVLCLPEPHWMMDNTYQCSARLPNNLVRLLDHLALRRAEVPVHIGGDLHHYRRHSRPDEALAQDRAGVEPAGAAHTRHLVTSGGGGAFLHPTHTRARGLRCRHQGRWSWGRLRCKLTQCRASDRPAECLGVRFGRPPDGQAAPHFPLAKEFPPAALSWARSLDNLAFLGRNPRFGLATGALYVALAWLMPAPRSEVWLQADSALGGLGQLGLAGLADLTAAPARMLLFLLVLLAFWAFTDTHRPLFRVVAAIAHGGAHLLAALVVTLAATDLAGRMSSMLAEAGLAAAVGAAGQRLAQWGLIFVGGYLAGSFIMGLYLLVSCTVFGRHGNEAFSSLRIADHKHFLRMRLDAAGLEVFVVGLDRVSRFTRRGDQLGERPGSPPVLIDRFAVPRPRAGSGAPG